MKAPVAGSDFDVFPESESPYIGRVIWFVDLGMQPKTFQGKTTDKHQILIAYATPDVVRDDNNEPRILTERMNLLMGERATLRQRIESIYGKKMTDTQAADFDVEKIAGRGLQFSVVHNTGSNGRTYANIQTVMPLPKGMAAPDCGPIRVILADEADKLNDMPEWLGDLCLTGWPLLKANAAEEVTGDSKDDFDDEIPF